MNESKNLRIALLSGGLREWSEALTPFLLGVTNSLIVVETVDELLSLPPESKPEIFFVCHKEGIYDGIMAAELLRVVFAETPLVLLAAENFDTLKAALTVGALAVLEPPVTESSFNTAFNRCSHLAQALKWEMLKSQQNRNRSELFMQSPCCHLFVDNAGGKVTGINSEASNILGIGADVLPTFSNVCKRFFAPHGSTYPQELEASVDSRSLWQGNLSGRTPNAPLRVFHVISSPVNLASGTSGMLVTLHEITKEQAEQEHLHISLQAALDWLAMASFPKNDISIMEHCFASNVSSIKEESFCLSNLLESATERGINASVHATIPDYIPKNFRGDVKRLEFALKALISGSAAYGSSSPQLSVSIKERTPEGLGIQFSIHVENRDVNTQNYQNAANYISSVSGKANAAKGIGLAAVIIEQMKGTILVRTELGVSRTVICTVPLIPETADGISSRTSSSSSAGFLLNFDVSNDSLPPLKILVAEDNQMEQTALKHLLESIGCQVVIVGNGKDAVDEFENGEFDIVFMDILMPVMDGFEATKLIRERERIIGGRIPVVALTSYSLKAVHDKCVSVGMNGYLAKPVAKKKLVEALQRIGMMKGKSSQYEEIISELNELPVLEARSILENIDYDLDLYRDLVKMYLSDYAAHGDELAAKIEKGDLNDILSSAHALKGIISNIGGQRLAEAARIIQDMCREGNKPDYNVWSQVLEVQTATIKNVLEELDWSVLETFVAEANR